MGTTTNTGTTPTTHTFSTNTDRSLFSFTLERAIQHTTDHVTTYEGMQVNSLTFRWAVQVGGGGRGNFITCEADVWGENVIESSTTTDLDAPATAGFQARNVILTLNSTAKAKCINGSFTINNNLSDGRYAYYSANTRFKGESQMQKRTFNGEFVLHYIDTTEFDFWDNAVVVPGTNTLVFQRGANDTLTCTFTNLRIISASDPTNLDGFNQITLRWIADTVAFVAVDADSGYIT